MEKNKTMSLTKFCMDYINNDPQLSKLQEQNPLIALGFIVFGVEILKKYQEALIEGIEFTVNMEDE